MPIKTNEREYRNINLFTMTERAEPEAPNTATAEGYATTYNEPYKLYESDNCEIWEEVDRNAFTGADLSDVILQYDHTGRVLARTSNNTLILDTDDPHGLKITANLSGTDAGRQLSEEIRGGYIRAMSMGFKVGADTWTREETNGKTIEKRTITKIAKLYDVSAVSIPANDATEISIRALTAGVAEKVAAERIAQHKNEIYKKIIKTFL